MSKDVTDEVFEVEKICGYRQIDGKYLVKWARYEEQTWESVDLLDNCRDEINAFWEKERTKKHVEILKPINLSDFRLENKLPFNPKDAYKGDGSKHGDLIPWPNDPNIEDEPTETSFFDLQRSPHLLFVERNQNIKWENCGREVFNENVDLDLGQMPNFQIEKIYSKEDGQYVQLKDSKGNIEEYEYDLIYSLFPNSVFEYCNYHFPRKVVS